MKATAKETKGGLTQGKEYKIIEENGNAYKVVSDNYTEGYYYKHSFNIVEGNNFKVVAKVKLDRITKGKEYEVKEELETTYFLTDDECFSCNYAKEFFDKVKETPSHYDNENGSLYLFAEQQKLNSWEFDIIKRIVRSRKKGNFIEDLQKTKVVIDLYLKEYDQRRNNK